jgi:2-dehydropantoate 2-reductase
MVTQNKLNIVIYGAGAIGTTLAAWLTNQGCKVCLLARNKNASQLRQNSVNVMHSDNKGIKGIRLNVIEELDPVMIIDLLIITVKNFDLEQVCQQISRELGDNRARKTLILALQNGVINQQILPRYFDQVIYGIVNYNAWLSKTPDNQQGLIWQVKLNGPLLLGTPDNSLRVQTHALVALFSTVMCCQRSHRFQDDAHAKLVANLGNAVTTIIANSHHQSAALVPLQQVFSQLSYEAVKILKAASFKESKTSLLPSWALISASIFIPAMLTRSVFRKKLALIGSTSMASDIISKGGCISELDSINGYLVNLAEQFEVPASYNQRLYQLCQQRFCASPFEPVSAQQLSDYLAGAPL